MTLYRIFSILLLSTFLTTNLCHAEPFKFRPTITIFESYSYIKNYSILNSGLFDTENSKFNIGFEVNQKIYIEPSIFFKLGLRYQHFNKNVYALNQIPELYNYPHPFYWENRYTAFSIPLHFGKDYYINNKKKGDWYFGLSLGILMTSYAKSGIIKVQPRDKSFLDSVIYAGWNNSDQNPNYFYPNIEAGVSFIPLKRFDKLSIGFNVSAQLNKTGETKHMATMEVPSQGYDFYYDFYNKNRFVNFSGSISYSF